MDDAVMQALKRHLDSAETLDVSRYQFVNMEAVKTAAGALWPEVRARVFLASRSIIERRIAEDDLVVQCATGFLVIYKATTGAMAEQTTARIRADLERFFLGERFADLMRVQATSERLTPAEFEAAMAEAGLEDADPEPPAAAPRTTHPGLLRSMDFHAAWDVRKEAVASYFAKPVVTETEGGPDLSEASINAALSRPEDRLAFDQAVLTRACAALETLLQAGTRCALIVPAGYGALSNSRLRAGYVTALAHLPRELKKLIWVRLVGAPGDTPASVIAETGRTLLPYTGQLFLDADIRSVTLERQMESDAHWLGARLPDKLTAAARQDVERFIALAKRAGRPVYFDGVNDWERLRYASRTPARLLVGAAIGRHESPPAPFRLTRNGLLARAA
ncbi:MAG: hypothetical protein RIA71_12160 [Oceanicaulis sp.]